MSVMRTVATCSRSAVDARVPSSRQRRASSLRLLRTAR